MGGLSLLGTCGKETEMTFAKDVCMDIHSSFTGRSPVLQTTPASSHGRTDRRLRANSSAGRCDEIKQQHGNLHQCVSHLRFCIFCISFFLCFLFYFLFYLLIIFWLHWSLWLHRVFSNHSEQGLLFIAVSRHLIAVAILVAEHRL